MSVSEKVGSGAIALLLVMSVLAPFAVGTASADTYTKTVDSSRAVVVETSGTDEAQIEIWGKYTEDGTTYTHFLRRATVTGDYKHYLVDMKAYDEYDVRVTTSSSTTTVSIYGDSYAGGGQGWNSLGHTGGDTDTNCDLGAQAGSVLGTFFTDCNPEPERSINLSSVSSDEAQNEIYKDALTLKTANDIQYTTIENYLQDTKSNALLVGKNEYIRQLNNGSTKSVARSEAKAAVNDYYSKRQIQLVKNWNKTATELKYLARKAESEPNTASDFVYANITGATFNDIKGDQDNTVTVTLQNSTSQPVEAVQMDISGTVTAQYLWSVNYAGASFHRYRVKSAPAYSGEIEMLTDDRKLDAWQGLETQAASVNDNLDVFINNTYDEYQGGDINNSDLVDPYLADREYGPATNFSSWAALSLTQLGTNTPEAMENTGNFTVTDHADAKTVNGILLSDENPTNGSFVSGETYDAGTLGGTQYVVTDSGVEELTGNFTVEEIRQKDGTAVNEVAYRDINYSTSNTSGYKKVLDQIATANAELDALQAAVAAGGGTSDGTGPPDFVAELLKSVGAPVNPVTRGAAVVGGGTGILAVVGRVIAG